MLNLPLTASAQKSFLILDSKVLSSSAWITHWWHLGVSYMIVHIYLQNMRLILIDERKIPENHPLRRKLQWHSSKGCLCASFPLG